MAGNLLDEDAIGDGEESPGAETAKGGDGGAGLLECDGVGADKTIENGCTQVALRQWGISEAAGGGSECVIGLGRDEVGVAVLLGKEWGCGNDLE